LSDRKPISCRLHYRRIQTGATLRGLSRVFSRQQYCSILGANSAVAESGGFSYWAAEPRDILELAAEQTDPFRQIENALSRYRLADADANLGRMGLLPSGMFAGGWIGYFSYEMGRFIERLPERALDDLRLPLIRLCFYDRIIAYDHRDDAFWIVALELPNDAERPQDKLASLERRLGECGQARIEESSPVGLGTMDDLTLMQIRRNMSRQEYLDAVNRVKRHIRDGDVYQVNLSHRFQVPFDARPIDLFRWQSRHNPCGCAAYIDADGFQIVSTSPEMFVTVRDGRIWTKPIKGTRPRIDGDAPKASRLNARRFHDLLTSEKEQAELNMIIDLERNDVARICKPGTREVVQPRTIETYPTVYHAVATIAGQLRDDVGLTEILRAMFPGGSITGAPKIRAMEIIEQLEPTARGVYTGAIGFVGLDASVCLNVAIRTIIITRGSAFVQTGGGIVADSDPQMEWEETLVKAKALLAGIQAVGAGRVVRQM
jgi:anthranilate/para-aminobenzoate synthase component I